MLEGQSEKFVLASKFTKAAVPNADLLVTGNGRKAASVEASLKRLKTDWIDIYCDDGNLTDWRRSKWLKGVVLVKMAA